MTIFRNASRLVYINYILVKNGLDEVVFSIPYFKPFRFLQYVNPWFWFRKNKLSRGERIRISLEQLGPIYVKFGQMLSTRRDLLPDDIADELTKLQDNVPPFSSVLAKAIIESELGATVEKLFLQFDETPLASASIAQVYAANLLDGRAVVIKVLRPNIEKLITRDINLIKSFANLIEKYWRHGKSLKPIEVVEEFEKSLAYECDLMREAANAVQLKRNFLNSDLLHVPAIDWDYTTSNVLVMERVYGIPIADLTQLSAYHVDLKKLAERGVEIFFTQVFRDCFFHADMHPGNIFVNPEKPNEPQYIAIDFGIMGSIGPEDQRYLAENLVAFFKRDYRKVAILHQQSGWIPYHTRIDEFEGAIRCVCEPIFEKPLKDISFGNLLLRLFQVARSFHMQVQPQLILLQKTLLSVEGLGRQIYPELDLWSTAKPFLEDWARQQFSLKNMFKEMYSQLPGLILAIPEMPSLIHDVLKKKQIQQRSEVLVEKKQIIEKSKKSFWSGFFSAVVICMAIGILLRLFLF